MSLLLPMYRNGEQAIGPPSEKAEHWRSQSEYPQHRTGIYAAKPAFPEFNTREYASMKQNSIKKLLSVMFCTVLIAVLALNMAACAGKEQASAPATVSYSVVTVDLEGNETVFEITSDKKIVGEELLARQILAGEESQYGLYIKTVNGITLDYEKDGMYWAFYIDGEYAMTGVDGTDAEEGATYLFKPEK